uniref:Polyphenol oxidase C-terminal domain-containing protein n=1 Tax=Aegilops tauschii subsp. strangulata TaxID=200361 RepID=A0A453D0J4_AEGTS
MIIEGIQVADHFKFVKFDVLVNAPESGGDAASGYCAGSVAMTPHMVRTNKKKGSMKTVARFGVCDLMDNIGADGDKTVVVSLVPRCGGELVTIGGVSIGYTK